VDELIANIKRGSFAEAFNTKAFSVSGQALSGKRGTSLVLQSNLIVFT